jgi:hypothetical protein
MICKWTLFLAAWLSLSYLSAAPEKNTSQSKQPSLSEERAFPSKIETRIFDIPPNFIWDAKHAAKNSVRWPTPAATSADPFSALPIEVKSDSAGTNVPAVQFRQSTRAFLEHIGIPFPKGTAAFIDPINHRLHVRHEPLYLNMIQRIVETMRPPESVAITVHLIQAPGPVLRTLAKPSKGSDDSTQDLGHLLLESERPGSDIRVLRTGYLLAKSGERSYLEAVTRHASSTETVLDTKGASTVKTVNTPVGFRMEVNPHIDSKLQYVELLLAPEFTTIPVASTQAQFREPVTGSALKKKVPQSQNGHLQTALRLKSGHAKMISLWRPQDAGESLKDDLLQAAFVTAEIIKSKSFTKEDPNVVEVDLTQPDALIKHTFTLPHSYWLDSLPEAKISAKDILRWHHIDLPGKSRATITDTLHLTVEANLETLDIIQQWVAEEWQSLPKSMGLTLNILRGPSPLLRRILHDSQDLSAPSNALKQIQLAVSSNQAKWVSTTYLQGKAGAKGKSQAIREHLTSSEVAWSGHSWPMLKSQMHPSGTVWEVEPLISPEGHWVHLSGEFTSQTAPPTSWKEKLDDPASKTDYEITRHDFHEAKVNTSTIFAPGQTRIIAAWRPCGRPESEAQDVLELAFVTVDILKTTFDEEAQKLTSQVKESSFKDDKVMVTRTIQVPSDFLSFLGASQSPPLPKKTHNQFAFEVLEAMGVPMPEGSSVIYAAGSDELILTNTLSNINIAQVFIGQDCAYPAKNVIFNLHLLQAKGDLIREILVLSARHANHSEELDRLLKGLTKGETTPIETLRIVTRGGQRATVENIREHLQRLTHNKTKNEETSVTPELRGVGSQMEIDPTVGADGTTIDINLAVEHHTAPPIPHLENLTRDDAAATVGYPLTDFHPETINTSLTMASGTARILAVWKPTGKPEYEEQDLLHIAILEAAAVDSEK